MNHVSPKELEKYCEQMRILNKIQNHTKKLRSLNVDGKNLKRLEESVLLCSLDAVDIIGDTVYLDFLKKNKIKTISEPNQHGWYQIQDTTKGAL